VIPLHSNESSDQHSNSTIHPAQNKKIF